MLLVCMEGMILVSSIDLSSRSIIGFLQSIGNFGELSEWGLEIFDDLKPVRCPRSLAPTLVTSPVRLGPSMSLIPFVSFSDAVFSLSDSTLQLFNDVTLQSALFLSNSSFIY